MTFKARAAALFVLAPLLILGPALGGPSAWLDRKSDLPYDPAIQQHRLDNGVRIVIRPNAEPRERVTLRLLVNAGSLHEADDERGLAHFLEHMVFRGTIKHPGDSLAQILQREGLGFGPDHTAFTNFDHTIYHLELPRNDEATLRLALSVFREYSSEAVIDAAALETERGVVLSEKAMRDTPELRYTQANTEFLWPQSLIARRLVIGDERVIRNAPREKLVGFYDAWYRPERLALVIVGDIDPALALRCATEIFGDMKGRGAPRPEPSDYIAGVASEPSFNIVTDRGMIGAALQLQHPRKVGVVEDTVEQRRLSIQRDFALAVFQRRLTQIAREKGDLFVSPSVGINTTQRGWETSSLWVSTRITLWKEMVAQTEQELRRAWEHGFLPEEIAVTRKRFLESLDSDVRAAKSRHSEMLAGQIVWGLLNGKPIATPEQYRDELTDILLAMKPEDCLAAFRSAWGDQPPHATLSGHPELGATLEELRTTFEASRKIAVAPLPPRKQVEFAYQAFGPEGTLVKDRVEQDLDVRLTEFANGVRFNFKSTRFAEDYVEIVARIPGGRLSLKPNQAGLDWFAAWAFIPGGLRRHDPGELADLLAGRSLGLRFNVGHDAFYLTARCSRRDLLLTLKLLTAHLTDPGWRDEAIPEAKASYGNLLSNILSTPGAPIRASAERIIFDDVRFGIPGEDEYYRHDLKELAEWLGPKLAKGPIEVSIVGDTTWGEASSAVAKTLGALPKRSAWPKKGPKPPRLIKPVERPIAFTVRKEFTQASIAWILPVPGLADVAQERRARLMADVVEERLRVRLRQQLGSAYAPETQLVQDDALPGLDYLVLYAEVDTARTEEALAVIRDEIDRLPREGITPDEFERSKAPFLHARADDVRNNDYWLHTVLADAQQRPERLASARSRTADTAAISREEVEAILRRTFNRKAGFLLISEPAPGRTWTEK